MNLPQDLTLKFVMRDLVKLHIRPFLMNSWLQEVWVTWTSLSVKPYPHPSPPAPEREKRWKTISKKTDKAFKIMTGTDSLENRRSSQRGGGGAHPLHPPLRSAPENELISIRDFEAFQRNLQSCVIRFKSLRRNREFLKPDNTFLLVF